MKDFEESERNQIAFSLIEDFLQKYIKETEPIYDTNYLNEKENVEDLTCAICQGILSRPKKCSNIKNSHSFCKICLGKWLKEHNECPVCRRSFKYIKNTEIKNELSKLSFKCMFNKEGCKEIIPYDKYPNHIGSCKHNNKDIEYECNVKKYIYDEKEFKKCGYIGKYDDVLKHFKVCETVIHHCLFCGLDLERFKLKEHVQKDCEVRIIKSGTNKYIGQMKNNLKNGAGKEFQQNGQKYLGYFKNGMKEDFWIIIHPSFGWL